MTKKQFQQLIKSHREMLGLCSAIRFVLYIRMKVILKNMLARMPKDRFDREYNVSTQDPISLADLGITNQYSIFYLPTHERVIRHVMNNINVVYKNYMFVDMGCGKGRAVLMAMFYPFKRIIGVELTELTSTIARDNVERLRNHKSVKCTDIEIQCKDATIFDPPSENAVYFLYKPFVGQTLNHVLDNICKSHANNNKKALIAYLRMDPPEERIFLSKDVRKLVEYKTFNADASWSLWEFQ